MTPLDAETIRQIIREEIRAVVASEPAWLQVSQAAQKLGVSENTIRRWAREGRIETKGAGKARLVKVG